MNSKDSKINELALLREQIRRKAATGSFENFIYYIDTHYKFNWHHKKICDKLESFLKDDTKDRLMIFVPPQHGKSQLASRLFPAYALGLNPDLKIVGASYSIDLARSFNRDIQRYIDSDLYRDIYPKTLINSKNVVTQQSWLRNSEEFEIINFKGSYKGVGVMGGLSGRPADIAIIDDPVKDAIEAESQTYRDRVWEWYVNVLETRLHNKSKVILIMTRWHEDDLAGRLLIAQPNRWDIIKIQAIKDEYDDDDPRQLGEVLWPEKHSLEKVTALRQLSDSTFESLYQQNPVSKSGNKIKRDAIEIVYLPTNLHTVKSDIYIDGAYTEKTKNDPTGLLEVKYDFNTKTLYVVNFVSERMELPELLKYLMSYFEQKTVPGSRIYIEPKASGKSIKQMINKMSNYSIIEIKNYLVNQGKEARFQVAAPYLESGKIKIVKAPWNDMFINQIVKFPKAKHDEAVDLIGYAAFQTFLTNYNSIQMVGSDNLV